MLRSLYICVPLLLASAAALADTAVAAKAASHEPAAKSEHLKAERDEKPQAPKVDAEGSKDAKPEGDVTMSGMSVLGNDEAPKSLVIVPWKSSQLGDAPGLSKLLDDATQPVDKDVFMRELAYYQIKSNSK
jgi:hypothetical protein